jgi:hypothetical protein
VRRQISGRRRTVALPDVSYANRAKKLALPPIFRGYSGKNSYEFPVAGILPRDRREERVMPLSIALEFRFWKWRLSIRLSRR